MMPRPLEELEQKLGYTFKDKSLLETALTHSSYANEHRKEAESYERLEFLGDSVLGFVAADYLFRHCVSLPEGELSKQRAALVCEKSLCEFSRKLGVGPFLRLSHGEMNTGGQNRPSILADVFESITAALYEDGGYEAASKFILSYLVPAVRTNGGHAFRDYKTALQEIVQQNPEERLEYVVVGEHGPDHNKHFLVEVHLNSNVIGRGGGHSKKEAEQQAAREALELMGY